MEDQNLFSVTPGGLFILLYLIFKFATPIEHILIIKACPGCHRLIMISVCAAGRCFYFYDVPTSTSQPWPQQKKKTSNPTCFKTGIWSIMSNSKWPYNNSCWGEENLLFTFRFSAITDCTHKSLIPCLGWVEWDGGEEENPSASPDRVEGK